MKVLQDIWILDKSGIVLFNRVFDEVVSPQLFGAMMSALNMFAEQLTEGGLSNFELNNKRFTIIKKNDFLFIGNSSKEIKSKKIVRELEKIVTKFFGKYSEDILDDSSGNLKNFMEFEEEIKDSLEEIIKKFQKAFW